MNPSVQRVCSGLALAGALILISGCVSTKYKMARSNAAPPVLLNIAAENPPLEGALNAIIIYRGPGSWKREAFWDEYFVTIANRDSQPLTITAAALADPLGGSQPPGTDPWALEKQSKSLERKYREAGVAFVRDVGGGILMAGAGVGSAFAAGAGVAASGAVLGAAALALPIYYISVWGANADNKAAVVGEFGRRRLVLPLVLGPGETRIGSFFFPMVPSPRSLTLRWSNGAAISDLVLPLSSVQGIHATKTASAPAGR